MTRFHAALACLTFVPAAAMSAGADLAKVERSVRKEPAYAAEPRYCLLVFGPEAKARIWLVLDGRTLYVDRNGNGDLTERGERLEPNNDSEALYQYEPVAVSAGGRYKVELHLYRSPAGKGPQISRGSP